MSFTLEASRQASRRHLVRFGLGAAGVAVFLTFVLGAALSPVSSADLLGAPGTSGHTDLVASRAKGQAHSPAVAAVRTTDSRAARSSVGPRTTRPPVAPASAPPTMNPGISTFATSSSAVLPPTPSQTALMNLTAPPAPFPNLGYGCPAAISYLTLYADPAFTYECPGWAEGHQAMTCEDLAPACAGQQIIVIATPCPAAYENEAWNSWHIYTGPIDPYGACEQ